jgi:adenylate kinase family enzyme
MWLTHPFDKLWKWLFALNFCKNESTKFFVTGISGGEYKTTLASSICEKYKLKHISTENGFVIEGCYSRPDIPSFHMVLDKFIKDVDVVIYLRIPWYVSMWRKAWRSCKRAIGASSQGTNPETLKNVYYMLKSVWEFYGEKRSKLDKMFVCNTNTNKNTKFICVDWPYYIIVTE